MDQEAPRCNQTDRHFQLGSPATLCSNFAGRIGTQPTKNTGVVMTLCIAAISRKQQGIVTVCDLMLSNEYMSLETESAKVQPVSPSGRWVSLFAGAPSVHANMLKEVYDLISRTPETSSEIVSAFESAFRNQLKRKIEGELLSPYGLDRSAFLREGRAYFGDEEFSRILYQMRGIRLDTSFLLAGYEPSGLPRLFSIVDPGISENVSALGFHAIGSGYVRALGSLYTTYNSDFTIEDLIYRICEAKFLGESASGVGERTFVDIVAPDGTHKGLSPELVEPIREIWKARGIPPVPSDAHAKIAATIQAIHWSKEPPG
jgi:hypothetical protein